MIIRILIICIIVLAFLYYAGLIMQSLFPKTFKITNKEISFLKAVIPFYYWIAGNNQEKTNVNKN